MFNIKSIRFRILLGFIVVLVIGAISSGYGLFSINKVGSNLGIIVKDDIPMSNLLADITTKQLEQAVLLERALRFAQIINDTSNAQQALEETEREFLKISEEVEKELQMFEEKSLSAMDHSNDNIILTKFEKIRSAGIQISKAHKNYSHHVETIFRSINQGRSDEIGASVREVLEEEKKLDTELEELLASINKFTEESAMEAYSQEQTAVMTMTTMTLVGIGIGMLLSFVIANGITGPLKKCMLAMNDIAEGDGDLTQRLDASGKDEISQLANAFNKFANKMHDVLLEVKSSTTSISVAAGQVAAGNLNLSQRTEEQASSLEETASSMEEMTSTVRQNADNSVQASQLAMSARDQAESGGNIVRQAVDAMAEINQSSSKIADIIDVVEEIAFQTNLLALNAAVEAARAGEQGRGFAVVASEVRALAGRSADSAKEIKTLIEDSVEKVKFGSTLVDQSGTTLQDIVTGVKKVADIVSEISAASQEQSAGIDQVNKAVIQMDEMTQQNASLVEESAAASRSMEEQTANLSQLMGFFKLDDRATLQMTGTYDISNNLTTEIGTSPIQQRISDRFNLGNSARQSLSNKSNYQKATSKNAEPVDHDAWKEF